MSKLHEIKAHTAVVKSTKKVTRAMYLTAASKSQKAKSQLTATLPYFNQIMSTMAEILATSDSLDTPYFKRETPSSADCLYVVLSSDKGMAGGYTHNLITFLDENVDKERATLLVAGLHGTSRIRRSGYRVDTEFSYPIMNPSLHRSREIAELVVKKYLAGSFREAYVVYTEMITPLRQKPAMSKLLPLYQEPFTDQTAGDTGSRRYSPIRYEPSAREVFDHLVPHYLKGIIYGAFVEAFTCEQNARMFSMDNATKNADEMLGKLTLQYNRERQAKITQELTEVIGGIPSE